jgi:hypothetical protein
MNIQLFSRRKMLKFTEIIFGLGKVAEKAASIVVGILKACSPRVSTISHVMEGKPESNSKAIQRFLKANDPREALKQLYWEQAPFVLGDPTEIERPQARKTSYVGKLRDGKSRGFQVLPLAFPYRGRAIPFHFITYSSRTIQKESTSRNWEHLRLIEGIKEIIGEKPLVMDREFSYGGFFECLVGESVNFVIRLNAGNKAGIYGGDGERLKLSIRPGERVYLRGVYYRGRVKVNLAGEWKEGFKEPLWVITTLEPEQALGIYKARMKIEESFKDLKSLLGLNKIMNKSRETMEKMVAMVLIAYAIGLLLGEAIREHIYKGTKFQCYSGMFILVRQRVRLSVQALAGITNRVHGLFAEIVLGGVPTFV